VGLQKAYNRNGRRITYGHSLALVVLHNLTDLKYSHQRMTYYLSKLFLVQILCNLNGLNRILYTMNHISH